MCDHILVEDQAGSTNLVKVIDYHEQTKHAPARYARSLGYMDWANQPDPFRRFVGAPQYVLEHPTFSNSPPYEEIFEEDALLPSAIDFLSISQLFYDSLALSAWKQAPGSKGWSLRVNPSSGNLHPTEAYLICGPVPGLIDAPALFHYSPYEHCLELRCVLQMTEWKRLVGDLERGIVFVGLSSIYWRESWKYGERAFRYCNHDVGHALGAVTMAAAALGLHSEIVSHIADKELDILVGIDGQEGIEAEHADCLLMLSAECSSARTLGPADELIESIRKTDLLGMPNDLSPHHRPWQIIEEVSAATCLLKKECSPEKGTECSRPSDACFQTPIRGHGATRGESVQTARQLFRQRRSAVAMDGVTRMSRETFFHMMQRATGSSNGVPYSALDWSPSVSLVVFVHRVDGLAPGLYCLVRHPRHERSLKESFDEEFLWEKVPTCPDSLSLYLLKSGDYQEVARDVSCYQDIASDGVFSVSMLAQFEPVLKSRGAWFYRRLFWETGMIGQVLYLEAEAAGVRATGIGCFHDDMMHGLLGIGDLMWQSLYHFTVGGAVEDLRLQTRPAYEHLS